MRSKLFLSVAGVLVASVLWGTELHASGVDPLHIKMGGPLWAVDFGRAISNIVKGILEMTGDGEYKAQLIATQEGTNANADGTPGSEKTDTSQKAKEAAAEVAGSQLQSNAYAYVKSEILSKESELMDLSQYRTGSGRETAQASEASVVCSDLGFSGNALSDCKEVVDTFFSNWDENDAYKNQIYRQRVLYANKAAARHVTTGVMVQQKIIEDLQAAGQAPVSSGNEVGAIAIDGQTLDEMLKITVADLALQVEMMEADALAFMLQQPVGIMKPDRPKVADSEQ